MRERPIIFSAPMVRAILAGQKTQTRRTVKGRGWEPHHLSHNQIIQHADQRVGLQAYFRGDGAGDWHGISCPYGQPGDQLWVREATHRRPMLNLLTGQPLAPEYDGGAYAADGADVLSPAGFDVAWWYSRKVCPALHMPRSASRITLEITGIRVERLQDISHADAMAEGMALDDAVYDYSRLWESLHGAGSWDANPWVWVVEFRRVEGGAA